VSDANLTLLVHDYDPQAAEERSQDLQAALPGAEVHTFNSRRLLLETIAALPPVGPGERWPLALIDLQGEDDRNARGEHLLATINEHPRLRGRVALVAFTRYGFDQHDEVLKAKGARAVLNPVNLHRQKTLASELQLLAAGSQSFVPIGEPPSRKKDREVVEKLASYFQELFNDFPDERDRWERARQILRICQLDREGFDDRAIVERVPGLNRRGLESLQDQLLASPAALAEELIAPMEKRPSLGRVIDVLAPYLDETPLIWDVTNERERIEGPGHLSSLRELIADNYPLDEEPPEDDEAWIPPTYFVALRRYLALHAELSSQKRGGNASTGTLFERTDAALAGVAAELGLGPEQARHYVCHAAMCLEDAAAERSRET
jgi:hypothetical protein